MVQRAAQARALTKQLNEVTEERDKLKVRVSNLEYIRDNLRQNLAGARDLCDSLQLAANASTDLVIITEGSNANGPSLFWEATRRVKAMLVELGDLGINEKLGLSVPKDG